VEASNTLELICLGSEKKSNDDEIELIFKDQNFQPLKIFTTTLSKRELKLIRKC